MTDFPQIEDPVEEKNHMLWKLGFVLGPVFALIPLFIDAPEGLSEAAWRCAGLALMMAVWWALEIMPIAITALLPLVMGPLLGLVKLDVAAAPYAHPVIFLYLGGFMLGLAMERWGLHRRIAIHVMLKTGTGEQRLVIGFMMATAFLSMWVSNTATAVMMLPIGVSVIQMLREEGALSRGFPPALLLAIAYGASIGGMATLIGTPPNALLAAFLEDNYGMTIGFAQWMAVGLPVSLLMLMITGWWLSRGGYQLSADQSPAVRQQLQDDMQQLGRMNRGEKMVAVVFVLAALSWLSRPLLIQLFPGLPLSDTLIAIIAGMALFLLPVQMRSLEFVMNWQTMKKLPWDVLLLFGGGLSIAAMIQKSGLATWVATQMSVIPGGTELAAALLVVTVIIFLTEITSNAATTAAFLPPLGALALSLDIPPALLAIPATLAASCAFMLPVATPPNAIVFGSGMLSIRQMLRSGLILNLAGIVVIGLLSYWLVGIVF
ncbi:SLC13 family permease [Parendozoicomonas haliclonae]|uniref:Sodium-dependent dicarboxylate transporter SdcS n=1 Tax=Parendozoicomonas haliclonae TaxID=1960125 RepID=A0A1X7AHS1_9GAMM|nr:DASS family sodium-coupled anion symporter [Parendozoicomonas haliclonae]SMA43488.1 Sodium-dependent dicarboxylate transporter SdcS [Parendozoicomonas haliclonae]